MDNGELEEILISADLAYKNKYKNIHVTTINKDKNLIKIDFISKETKNHLYTSCIVKDKLQLEDVWYRDGTRKICYLSKEEESKIEEYLNKLIILLK